MPIFIIAILFLHKIADAQSPIGRSLNPITGDLYHTGGNIGIGTDRPFKLLHLYSDTLTTFRLSSMWYKCDTTSWDLSTFQGDLNLYFKNTIKYLPVMKLNEYGQFYLGDGNLTSSAMMQIESTNRGLLIPRMTTNNKNTINSPANGLLVFDTDLQTFSYYNASLGEWSNIAKVSDFSDYLLISDFNTSVAGGITQSDTTNWNTAYNFSQNFTETDPIFTAWDKDYNDLTNTPDFTGWDIDASDDFDGQ